MNKNDQISIIFEKLKESKPAKAFKKVPDLDSGMKLVLMYLNGNNEEIYASTISEKMNISRARVGILLKKMENKNYITKTISDKDARIEVINITDKGLAKCREIEFETIKCITILIDKIGYDELNNFLDTANKIKNVIEGAGND